MQYTAVVYSTNTAMSIILRAATMMYCATCGSPRVAAANTLSARLASQEYIQPETLTLKHPQLHIRSLSPHSVFTCFAFVCPNDKPNTVLYTHPCHPVSWNRGGLGLATPAHKHSCRLLRPTTHIRSQPLTHPAASY